MVLHSSVSAKYHFVRCCTKGAPARQWSSAQDTVGKQISSGEGNASLAKRTISLDSSVVDAIWLSSAAPGTRGASGERTCAASVERLNARRASVARAAGYGERSRS